MASPANSSVLFAIFTLQLTSPPGPLHWAQSGAWFPGGLHSPVFTLDPYLWAQPRDCSSTLTGLLAPRLDPKEPIWGGREPVICDCCTALGLALCLIFCPHLQPVMSPSCSWVSTSRKCRWITPHKWSSRNSAKGARCFLCTHLFKWHWTETPFQGSADPECFGEDSWTLRAFMGQGGSSDVIGENIA